MQTVQPIAATQPANPFKVGDVLCSSWGYDQTNASFYKVIAVTAKQVTLQQYGTTRTESSPRSMSGTTTPDFTHPLESPIRRAVKFCDFDGGRHYVKIESYERAYAWDGKPQNTSWYA